MTPVTHWARAAALALTAAWLVMAGGCKSEPEVELPTLLAPADLTADEEAIYLYAHLEQVLRSGAAGERHHLDDVRQFDWHKLFITIELDLWIVQTRPGSEYLLDYDLKQAQLDRTPEASAYRGVRERAMAVGLLARSLWERNPPERIPSEAEMHDCRPMQRDSRCAVPLRTRVLWRAIRWGLSADRKRFAVLQKRTAAAEQRRR